MGLLSLPFECCLQVYSVLDLRDILAVSETCTALRAVAKDDVLWKGIATVKWGETALKLSHESGLTGPSKWFSFCMHRMCVRSHTLSPLELIQEQYPDPWQHLVCCLLCSRTTGGAVVRRTIVSFLHTYDTPSALLQATPKEIEACLDPVGLQEVRRKALMAMTHSFFAEDWTDPSEFHGCGSFTKESWMIFCQGCMEPKLINDTKLRAYLRWLKSGKVPVEPVAKRRSGVAHQRKGAGSVLPSTRTLRSGRRR